MIKPFICFGTRPEAIKLAPVIRECANRDGIKPFVCSTGQHREMLDDVINYFDIPVHVDLNVMTANQTLSSLTTTLLEKIGGTIEDALPDCVIAQGDTTTVMVAAMTAFYHKIPLCHVEAGLRTYDLQSPWPEEFNRRVAGLCASLHFAPTQKSVSALLKEGVPKKDIYLSGNTVIDSLLWAREKECSTDSPWQKKYEFLKDNKMILVTGHRRENFGQGFENLCAGLQRLAAHYPNIQFVYPVHLNPNVQKPVYDLLGNLGNFHLVSPTPYPEFIWLMNRSHLIITDSGGVQEEGPSFKKPILVTRETTERPEAVDAGAVTLTGSNAETIFSTASRLLDDDVAYASHTVAENPYGDGTSSKRIVDVLLERFNTKYS